jgi:hypothetical protein
VVKKERSFCDNKSRFSGRKKCTNQARYSLGIAADADAGDKLSCNWYLIPLIRRALLGTHVLVGIEKGREVSRTCNRSLEALKGNQQCYVRVMTRPNSTI